jgi:Ca2+-binding RTX toxin-like protein
VLTRAARPLLLGIVGLVMVADAPAASAEQCAGVAVPPQNVLTAGDDIWIGTPDDDVVASLGGNDTLSGLGGNDLLCPGDGNDTANGGDGNDGIFGDAGTDTLAGDNGDDLVMGFAGNDTLQGGAGFDSTEYWDVSQAPNGYTVDVNLPQNSVVTPSGTDQLFDIESVFASDYEDRLIGDAAKNDLYGGEEDDVIDAGAGDDRVFADGDAQHDINNPDGADDVHGGAGNDYINGLGAADMMFGDAGADILNGEAGADQIMGGDGYDFGFYACNYGSPFCTAYRQSGSGVNVDMETGVVSGGQGNDQLSAVEGVIGSDYGDTLLGSPTATDDIAPRMGNDIVDGRGGANGDYVEYICEVSDDVPCGGNGNGVRIDLGAGIATGAQGTDQLMNIEHAVGSTEPDTIIGSAGDNELFGQHGDDLINGAGGNDGITGEEGDDTLAGGDGMDRLDYAFIDCSDGTGVDLHVAGGTATGDGSDTILPDFEQLIGSRCADVLVGSSAREQLFGSGGSDVLSGRGGNDLLVPNLTPSGPVADPVTNGPDAMFGGSGDDTVSYSGASGGIAVDLASGAVPADGDGSTDRVYSVEAVFGSTHGDTIGGSAAANLLLGGDGNDSISGRGGNDYLDGQLGNDALDGGLGRGDFVDYHDRASQAAAVSVALAKKTATVATPAGAQTDQLAGIEGVAGTDAADKLFGDAAGNFLIGEGGNDGTIAGKAGDDVLVGERGEKLRGAAGSDSCFGGKKIGCEKPPRKLAKIGELNHLGDLRNFRTTGLGAIQQLENALDAMRVHRRQEPPTTPPQ